LTKNLYKYIFKYIKKALQIYKYLYVFNFNENPKNYVNEFLKFVIKAIVVLQKKTPISRLVLYKTLSEFKTLTGLILLVRIP
jgi:hypothetical protein